MSNTHKNKAPKLEEGGERINDTGVGRDTAGRAGAGLQTWRGECVVTPSVSSGYGHSGSGQAGTGIQRVKSIGAERRGLFPLIIFTHECLSNNGL